MIIYIYICMTLYIYILYTQSIYHMIRNHLQVSRLRPLQLAQWLLGIVHIVLDIWPRKINDQGTAQDIGATN